MNDFSPLHHPRSKNCIYCMLIRGESFPKMPAMNHRGMLTAPGGRYA